MSSNKSRVLFGFSGKAVFEQYSQLSEALKRNGNYESVFWSPNDTDEEFLKTVGQKKNNLNKDGNLDKQEELTKPKDTNNKKYFYGSIKILKSPVIWCLKQLVISCIDAYNFRNMRLKMSLYLKQVDVDCIIVSDERSPMFLPLVAEACKLSKPVFLLPSNYLCMPDGGAYMRQKNRELLTRIPWQEAFKNGEIQLSILNRVIAILFPGQVFSTERGGMFCYPARDILALFMAGLLPKKLWYQGTRFATQIIISGDEELDVCRIAGIPDEKIAKIGNPIFEMLQKKMENNIEKRNDIAQRFKFSPKRKIIVFAIPVAWEHKMVSREQQFSVLEEVFNVISENITSEYKRPIILLSLHPKSKRKDYIELSNRFNAHIVEENLSDFLSVADFFIAGAYSSTIRWALALKIQAINLDFWNMNESTYDKFQDFPTVKTVHEVSSWYKKIMNTSKGEQAYGYCSLGMVVDKGFYIRMQDLIESVIRA
jgi:hypothetical protein